MAKIFKKSYLRYVANRWGKEDEDPELSMQEIEEFFVAMMRKQDWILDDLTWNDLNMNQVYGKINRTFSSSGQQCLYNMLRILRFDEEELKRRDRVIQFFQHNKTQREMLSAAFCYLGKEKYDGACSLLYKGIPKLPDYVRWLVPMTIGMVLSIVSIFFIGARALLPILIFFIINMVLHNKLNVHSEATVPAIAYIGKMLRAADAIAKLDYKPLDADYNEFFRKCVVKCGVLLRKTKHMGPDVSDPIGLSEYVKMLFLTEARSFVRCLKYVEENAAVLRVLYRKLGELDALQSVASFRRGLRQYAAPEFTADAAYLEAEEIVHPLLRNAVSNTITMNHHSVVITGSNMSGKSTFLRTLAVNAVMAQTIYTATAKKYVTSFFTILTSISPSDDLMEGTSYYMAEAEALLRMLNVVSEERCSLLIIDEIFRGTNPTERVAAASSLLQYLAKRNTMVVVATHDIEITQKVRDQYDSYHFTENVTRESLDFDYKLRPGILKSPNGIRILEYIGYPEEITEAALRDVEETAARKESEEDTAPEAALQAEAAAPEETAVPETAVPQEDVGTPEQTVPEEPPVPEAASPEETGETDGTE